mmetsp:Transcript_5578/g.8564  ORF Transcript_5578/g.8564 Transcript_5578/m.8564 type:complete len:120 (-) Transcript_5578:282-641(-)
MEGIFWILLSLLLRPLEGFFEIIIFLLFVGNVNKDGSKNFFFLWLQCWRKEWWWVHISLLVYTHPNQGIMITEETQSAAFASLQVNNSESSSDSNSNEKRTKVSLQTLHHRTFHYQMIH